ncbi:LAMI_0B00958g1_1 [Lachancea mirantina]|uniref:LAMI_0B00958g1_1 n=1 Tax=Lachancea mirantina TaxID=1230905 RepID=A0A1G4IT54_9SACH|nr:LAMI_0B00958g1_1 [Lachancea mirantina]
MTIQTNKHIDELAVLQSKVQKEYALEILRDIAHQVSYLMRENGLKVRQLVEFYPRNKRLLGMNVNSGAKIMLRLRDPYNDATFLSRESILGVMLHELTHNIFGPHNASFYRKLDEFTGRQWVIEQKGLYDAFVGKGRKLGTRSRSQLSVTTSSGRRLGGAISTGSISRTPAEMASWAAENRAQDSKWCVSAQRGAATSENLSPAKDELGYVLVDSESENETESEPATTFAIEIIDLT